MEMTVHRRVCTLSEVQREMAHSCIDSLHACVLHRFYYVCIHSIDHLHNDVTHSALFAHLFLLAKGIHVIRAGGTGLAALVLAGPIFEAPTIHF